MQKQLKYSNVTRSYFTQSINHQMYFNRTIYTSANYFTEENNSYNVIKKLLTLHSKKKYYILYYGYNVLSCALLIFNDYINF